MQQIGKKIQTLRKNKHITQEQLAEVLSISAQAVSKWENGGSTPDITLLPMIARYFGITMDELFNYRLDALNYKERFLRFMVDNGVLRFGRFELQSGRISPYFIDTGAYRSSAQIAKLGEFYASCIRENNIQTNVLLGACFRALPATLAANMILYHKYGMDINYCFEQETQIGKKLEKGDAVTVVADTLTSGESLRTLLTELRKKDQVRISGVVISIDRMELGKTGRMLAVDEIRKEFEVEVYSIVTMEDVIRAMENGVIGGEEHLKGMKEYRRNFGQICN